MGDGQEEGVHSAAELRGTRRGGGRGRGRRGGERRRHHRGVPVAPLHRRPRRGPVLLLGADGLLLRGASGLPQHREPLRPQVHLRLLLPVVVVQRVDVLSVADADGAGIGLVVGGPVDGEADADGEPGEERLLGAVVMVVLFLVALAPALVVLRLQEDLRLAPDPLLVRGKLRVERRRRVLLAERAGVLPPLRRALRGRGQALQHRRGRVAVAPPPPPRGSGAMNLLQDMAYTSSSSLRAPQYTAGAAG